MAQQPDKIICSMIRVSKFYDKKPIIQDISLSYFYGAKIGVLGLNGSGKTTLLRIMAGIEKDFNGELTFAPGYSVGYLEQEPALDENKTVRQVVEEGVQEIVNLINEYNRINEKFSEPMSDDEMDKLLARHELEAGRAVQRALMPDRCPTLTGWDVWLYTRPANDVGGDLVDCLEIEPGRVGFALADVAGKALPAALLMAKVQSTLRALATDAPSLSALAARSLPLLAMLAQRRTGSVVVEYLAPPQLLVNVECPA